MRLNIRLNLRNPCPEDHYDYTPMAVEMTFREQLKHIAANMVWLSSSYLEGKHTTIDPTKTGDSKREIISMMNQAFTYANETINNLTEKDLNETVDFFAGTMTRRRILLLMTDHVTHHRGQLVVYLRMNNVNRQATEDGKNGVIDCDLVIWKSGINVWFPIVFLKADMTLRIS